MKQKLVVSSKVLVSELLGMALGTLVSSRFIARRWGWSSLCLSPRFLILTRKSLLLRSASRLLGETCMPSTARFFLLQTSTTSLSSTTSSLGTTRLKTDGPHSENSAARLLLNNPALLLHMMRTPLSPSFFEVCLIPF